MNIPHKRKTSLSPVMKRFLKSSPSKKKKRKSTAYDPYKNRNSLNSDTILNSSEEVISEIPLRPSTSETDIYEELICPNIFKTSSEISLRLQNRKLTCAENRSDFDVRNTTRQTESIYSNDSSNYLSSISPISPESSDLLHGFLEETIQMEVKNSLDNSIGDISDLMCSDEESRIFTDDFGKSSNITLNYDPTVNTEEMEEPTTSSCSDVTYKSYETNSDYIVVVNYSQAISLFGYCDLKVLHGKIRILGFKLSSRSPRYTLYSPRGTSLLKLENDTKFCDELLAIKFLVPSLAKYEHFSNIKVRKDSAIILFLKKNDSKMNIIEQHISQKITPKQSLYPCIEIEPKGSWNSIAVPEEWQEIVDKFTSDSKILICGGKGVGKSTFLRYISNSLLQKYGRIKVFDLDPGQSEFTVPGSISVVEVSEPLLGVNYTHLKEAERSILCDINVAQDPHKYIKSIEKLAELDSHTKGKRFPVLVNYMGFTNDIAYHLISSAIAIMQPNEIIYLKSYNKKKNFKTKLTREKIEEHIKLFTPNLKLDFEVNIMDIASVTDENTGWTLQPRQMRELCILSYFGQNLDDGVVTLQDYRLPMFKLDLNDVSITDRNNKIVPVEAVNANIVALCSLVDPEFSVFQCYGWGIVRSVDPVSKNAIIITPANSELLEEVTHLVAGCLTLPPSVYMNQESVQGKVPYVMVGELINFAQMSKRTLIPVNTFRT